MKADKFNVRLWSVLCVFLAGSICSGLVFTCLVTRPALQVLWFRTEEFWVLPTGKFWVLSAGLFFLNLAGSCLVIYLSRWLSFPGDRLLISVIPLVFVLAPIWSLATAPTFSNLLIFRIALPVALSLTLFIITKRWFSSVASMMLAVSLSASLIASVPYTFLETFPPEWFEAARFVVASSLLSISFGYWLVKSCAK